LALHGWVYEIGAGTVKVYDEANRTFESASCTT
jgi:carbonic anhydrase